MKNRSDLTRLAPAQLVAEIRGARTEIERTAQYIAEASLILHTKARKAPSREQARVAATYPEGTSREAVERIQQAAAREQTAVYTLFANTWQRFAGMVLQGARRSVSSDRFMKTFEERYAAPEPEPTAPPKRTAPPVTAPPGGLEELYGTEMVTHAQQ